MSSNSISYLTHWIIQTECQSSMGKCIRKEIELAKMCPECLPFSSESKNLYAFCICFSVLGSTKPFKSLKKSKNRSFQSANPKCNYPKSNDVLWMKKSFQKKPHTLERPQDQDPQSVSAARKDKSKTATLRRRLATKQCLANGQGLGKGSRNQEILFKSCHFQNFDGCWITWWFQAFKLQTIVPRYLGLPAMAWL